MQDLRRLGDIRRVTVRPRLPTVEMPMPMIPNGVTRGQDLSEQVRVTDRLSAQAKKRGLG